jgi:hypothetical protein
MLDLAYIAEFVLILVFVLGVLVVFFIFVWMGMVMYLKHSNREEVSMNFVLLQILVPRDNEVKIETVEQMLSSLYSLKKGGFWSKFKAQQHISL